MKNLQIQGKLVLMMFSLLILLFASCEKRDQRLEGKKLINNWKMERAIVGSEDWSHIFTQFEITFHQKGDWSFRADQYYWNPDCMDPNLPCYYYESRFSSCEGDYNLSLDHSKLDLTINSGAAVFGDNFSAEFDILEFDEGRLTMSGFYYINHKYENITFELKAAS